MKRLIALALVFAALIATAIAAAPFIAGTDFAKQKIAAQIAEWTGHPVSFDGEPRVKLFPFLSLTIENAHIGGPDDAGEPFVSMDRLTCKLRLLPFLLGQLDVAEFQLVRPHFRLAIEPDGGASWLIDASTKDPEGAKDPAPRTSVRTDSERLAETRLGRFNIIEGLVTYDDARNGRHEEFSAVSANLAWPLGKDSVSGRGKFMWREETVEFNVAVEKPLQLLSGGTSPARFAIASSPLRFSFTGTADTSSGAGARMAGPATVTTPSVRRVFQWLGMETGEGAILGAGLIDGPLTLEGQRASFNTAQIELDGNVARGSFAVDFRDTRPQVDAALSFERLDLTAYLESLQSIETAWPTVPSLLPLVDLADAKIEIAADDILIGTARMAAGRASVSVGDDAILLHIKESRLYGGQLRADGRLEARGDALHGQAQIEVEQVTTGAVLDQLGLPRSIDGRLTAKGAMSAGGRTIEEIATSAAGEARFEIVDGTLGGVELTEFAALSGAPGVSDPAAGSGYIPFATLGGSVTLDTETLTSADLHIKGKTFKASSTAELGLATSLIRARGTLEIQRARNPNETRSVPFMVGGSWAGPVLLPDYERLIQGYQERQRIAPTGDSSVEFTQPKG